MSAEQILSRLELLGVKLGLDSIRRVLQRLGDPHAGMPVVLVAGTNGKGSTAALIASVAAAAGYRTGLFTSPHVERVEERIRLDGRTIDSERLGEILERVVRVAEGGVGHPPTYFEALTEAAFVHFAEQRVELAVMETGMGGRLDATNAAEPVLSVITEIGLDHTLHLGATLERIAREKAGILRRDRPAVAWAEAARARRALGDSAAAVGAGLEMIGDLWPTIRVTSRGLAGQSVAFRTAERSYELDLQLGGRHQARNLCLAVRSLEILADLGWERIEGPAISRGVAACRWPGRLELVETLTGSRVLLDAAHNPQAIAGLEDFLAEVEPEFDLLFGALQDKQVAEMLPRMANRAAAVTLTAPDSSRAVAPADLRRRIAGREGEIATLLPSSLALDRALRPDGRLLVVCGSIYLIGEARRHLRRRFGVPPPTTEIPVAPPLSPAAAQRASE